MEKKAMSFAAAVKDYFGFRPGENLSDFMKELKELNEKDREDLKSGLESVGYEIKPTSK